MGRLITLLILLSSTFSAQAADWPHTIDVYRLAHMPITGINTLPETTQINIHDVGAVQQMQKKLSKHLSQQPQQAQQQLVHWIKNSHQQQKQLAQAWQTLLLLKTNHIQQVPALVFDNDAVLLGESDLTRALKHWRSWKQKS